MSDFATTVRNTKPVLAIRYARGMRPLASFVNYSISFETQQALTPTNNTVYTTRYVCGECGSKGRWTTRFHAKDTAAKHRCHA